LVGATIARKFPRASGIAMTLPTSSERPGSKNGGRWASDKPSVANVLHMAIAASASMSDFMFLLRAAPHDKIVSSGLG